MLHLNHPSPPLLTSESGSFAEKTIATRIPGIINRVLTDHESQYPPEIVANLQGLREEIMAYQPVQPPCASSPDSDHWCAAWLLHQGKAWFQLPWYFAGAKFQPRND